MWITTVTLDNTPLADQSALSVLEEIANDDGNGIALLGYSHFMNNGLIKRAWNLQLSAERYKQFIEQHYPLSTVTIEEEK
jgi:hypothetical protein